MGNLFLYPLKLKLTIIFRLIFEKLFFSISEIKMKTYTLAIFLMVVILFVLTQYADSKMLMGKGGGNVDI